MSGRGVLGLVVGLAATFAVGLVTGRTTAKPAGTPEAVAAAASGASGEAKPAEEEKESKPKVKTAGVDRSVVSNRLVCFGSARSRPGAELLVTARAAAIVAEVLVHSGDKVTAGQTLLRLDARSFTATRQKAEGALHEAQAELQKATRGALAIELAGLGVALEQARADSLQADRSFARQQQLQTGGLVSEKQLQDAESGARIAKLRLEAAEQQLERARGSLQGEERMRLEARVAQAQADVDTALLQESLCDLKSPVEGVVSELDVVAGQAVDVTTPLARVATPTVIDAVLSVPAERAGKIVLGADVRLLSGGTEVARARVAGVAAAATPDGFVRVRAEVVDPELVQRVLPGTPLAGEVALGQLEALTVPSSAVVQDHDRTVIVIVEKVHDKTPDGKDDEKDVARKVAVKVLLRDGLVVAIEGPAPLALHAHVVIEGAYNLPDGAEVDVDDEEKTPGFSIAAWLVRHRRSLYVAAGALAVLGVLALGRLSSGIYPDVAFPRISIIAEAGEDAVENVELSITRPLEQTVSVVQNVRRVRSKTTRGACEMSVDFEPSADMRQALQDVRARIASIQAQLPSDLKLTVERQMPSLAPVISFYTSIDPTLDKGRIRDNADLTDWALLELKPRLARLPDVFLVTIQSHDVHEIVIEVKPDQLVARNISMADVNDAVGKSNLVGSVGRLDRDGKWFQVLVTGQFRSLADIAALAIPAGAGKAVLLGDVATIKESVADRTSIVTGDGKDAVLVNVFMRAGGRVTVLSKNVLSTVAEVKKLVPPAISFTPVYDQADLVNESLAGVRDAILLGGLLSIVILFVFLRDVRATLIAAPSIPLAIVGTFAFMQPLGLTLNLMSLGGIAIAIGLVVDDAIVVVECGIARHLGEGKGRLESVDLAIREVAGAVVGSSLTTIVVFAPLVLLEGVAGQFMQALSITLSIAILLSLLVSLTIIPVFALGRFGPRSHKVEGASRVTAAYERAARWVLGHRKISWLVLVAVLVVAWVVGDPQGHTGILPEMDEGSFVIDTRSPVGTALPETDRHVREIEDVLKGTKEIRAFSRRTGQELGLFATEPWKGDILVSLKPRGKDRQKTGDDISDDLRDTLAKAVPQLELEFAQLMSDTLADMSGNPEPIEVKVFGRDHRLLADAVERARKKLQGVKGLVSISRGMSFGSPELFFRVDSAAAARRGIATDDVEKETRSSLAGNVATTMRWGERLVPVRVRWPDSLRFDVRWMEGIPVTRDTHVPLSSVSTREEFSNANELQRENQQPMATVTARLKGIDLGEATTAVKAALKDLALPDGSRIEYGGQSATQEQMFWSILVVLALAVFLVMALLVAQFRSFGRAVVIFLALPFSQVGGLLALRLTNVPVNMSSLMGLIMLVGLVVKNGILLVDHADRLRESGVPLEEALVQAGSVRLRPIVMTSLTAIAGLVPLALNLGSGAELQRPLAIAVIGGLSLSTVFTLAVVPLGTLIFARKEPEA